MGCTPVECKDPRLPCPCWLADACVLDLTGAVVPSLHRQSSQLVPHALRLVAKLSMWPVVTSTSLDASKVGLMPSTGRSTSESGHHRQQHRLAPDEQHQAGSDLSIARSGLDRGLPAAGWYRAPSDRGQVVWCSPTYQVGWYHATLLRTCCGLVGCKVAVV